MSTGKQTKFDAVLSKQGSITHTQKGMEQDTGYKMDGSEKALPVTRDHILKDSGDGKCPEYLQKHTTKLEAA